MFLFPYLLLSLCIHHFISPSRNKILFLSTKCNSIPHTFFTENTHPLSYSVLKGFLMISSRFNYIFKLESSALKTLITCENQEVINYELSFTWTISNLANINLNNICWKMRHTEKYLCKDSHKLSSISIRWYLISFNLHFLFF